MNAARIQIDDAPLNKFHVRITALTFGSNFSDGYALGIISMALSLIGPQMHLGPVWQGLLGSSALIGLFFGSLLLGWLSDHIGRQKIYLTNFVIVTVASALQYFVNDPVTLFILRILIGLALGGDYAVGSTLLAEFAPKRYRGVLLSALNVLWTVGYTLATIVGYYLQGTPDAWRWMLASGAIPGLIVLLLRIGTPESPRWLIRMGREQEARSIVKKYVGQNVEIDAMIAEAKRQAFAFRDLFAKNVRMRTVFGSLFYVCNVIPYFAIYTFLPTILSNLGFEDNFGIDTILNIFLLVGAIAGLWFTERLSRRGFTIYSFACLTVALFFITILPTHLHTLILILFIIFTFIMSAASNLTLIYPAELFPTDVRASGVGVVTAVSRVGSAIGTFLLPLMSVKASMFGMTAVLLFGTLVSVLWAPETARLALDEASNPLHHPAASLDAEDATPELQ
ncbi:MFS transporter [Alicyclobacillus shizuokensis]|uniref:MFS transporter n=1 Tax=Alicyclobacillus shizuokensis TaxID=392014 RepID=UPI0009F8369D|nr:MFS transporter [Alicyclobacillus shizuokensis]MCL6624985.1 MFS transporter [Alicyclobacillus shizuokensis]